MLTATRQVLFSDDPGETHDGNFVTRSVMEGLIDPERTIQIGIRGSGSWAWEFSQDTGMRVVYAEEVQERGNSGGLSPRHARLSDHILVI